MINIKLSRRYRQYKWTSSVVGHIIIYNLKYTYTAAEYVCTDIPHLLLYIYNHISTLSTLIFTGRAKKICDIRVSWNYDCSAGIRTNFLKKTLKFKIGIRLKITRMRNDVSTRRRSWRGAVIYYPENGLSPREPSHFVCIQ